MIVTSSLRQHLAQVVLHRARAVERRLATILSSTRSSSGAGKASSTARPARVIRRRVHKGRVRADVLLEPLCVVNDARVARFSGLPAGRGPRGRPGRSLAPGRRAARSDAERVALRLGKRSNRPEQRRAELVNPADGSSISADAGRRDPEPAPERRRQLGLAVFRRPLRRGSPTRTAPVAHVLNSPVASLTFALTAE